MTSATNSNKSSPEASSTNQHQRRPFIIGVSGGTASGKSTVCQEIMNRVSVDHPSRVAIVSQDAFYRPLSEEEHQKAFLGEFNFDHPSALNQQLMLQVLNDLKASKTVTVHKYDFKSHSSSQDLVVIEAADVILVEGILIFYYQEIRDVFDMKLFVDTDPDTRLARRVQRDINERGRNLQKILHQYLNLVKPAYEEFCLPTKKYADVIIPRGAENKVAIDLIVQHVLEILRGSRRPSHLMRGLSLNMNGAAALADASTTSQCVNGSGNVSRRNDVIRPH